MNYLETDRYLYRAIASDHLLAVVSRHHRVTGRSSLALAELANENYILFDRGTIGHELAVDACRAAGFDLHIFCASRRVESVLRLVASNVGISLMMEEVVRYHSHLEVAPIPLEETSESTIILAAPKERGSNDRPNFSWNSWTSVSLRRKDECLSIWCALPLPDAPTSYSSPTPRQSVTDKMLSC